jgi:Flp pilus assembly protein TadB
VWWFGGLMVLDTVLAAVNLAAGQTGTCVIFVVAAVLNGIWWWRNRKRRRKRRALPPSVPSRGR